MQLPRISTVLLGLGLALSLSSCDKLRRMETENRAARLGGPAPSAQGPTAPGAAGAPISPMVTEPVAPPGANPPVTLPPSAPVATLPPSPLAVGLRVPGQPDIVRSPYTNDPNALLNVKGLPSGTEVADPYTGKTFLVP